VPDSPIPWAGIAALVAMLIIPFLPGWLFEGPRTIRHWPRRHVCGECGTSWTDGHVCTPGVSGVDPPLHGEIHRPEPAAELIHRGDRSLRDS
jgi:hypothetical protein